MNMTQHIPFSALHAANGASLRMNNETNVSIYIYLFFFFYSIGRHFEAEESRMLRVSINSFFEHLRLVSQTMDSFGPPR